MPKLQKHP